MDFARGEAVDAFLQQHVYKQLQVRREKSKVQRHAMQSRACMHASGGARLHAGLTCHDGRRRIPLPQEHGVAGAAVCVAKAGRYSFRLARTYGCGTGRGRGLHAHLASVSHTAEGAK